METTGLKLTILEMANRIRTLREDEGYTIPRHAVLYEYFVETLALCEAQAMELHTEANRDLGPLDACLRTIIKEAWL